MENRTKIIKQALAKIFGNKNVSVRKDSGTASGWILVRVEIENDEALTNNEVSSNVEKIIKETGVQMYTYSSDDGYGGDHDCLLIDVIRK